VAGAKQKWLNAPKEQQNRARSERGEKGRQARFESTGDAHHSGRHGARH